MKSDFFKKRVKKVDKPEQGHFHKHYLVNTKFEFEPLDPEEHGEDAYRRVEYAVMMCNSPCNNVKKVKVEKELTLDEQ